MMTITLGSLRITLFKIERIERLAVQIDQTQRKAEAEAITNSKYFQSLKAQAAAYRSNR